MILVFQTLLGLGSCVWGSSVSCILRIMLNITVVCGVFVMNLYFSALVSNTIDVVVSFHKKMNSKRGVQASIAVYEPERITFFLLKTKAEMQNS